jgi:hypothetical protein
MKEYIKEIVRNGKQEDMDCLSDILVDLLYEIKETNHNEFKRYKNKIKGMAYNYEIDQELAKEIVEDMKPLGEYWSMETVENAINNDTHRLCDMYVVMNSLVNDYQNVINPEEVTTYINMAHAWLDDIDAKPHKVWSYFI